MGGGKRNLELEEVRGQFRRKKIRSIRCCGWETCIQKVKRDQYGCHKRQCFYFPAPWLQVSSGSGLKDCSLSRCSPATPGKNSKTDRNPPGPNIVTPWMSKKNSQINVIFYSFFFFKKKILQPLSLCRQHLKSLDLLSGIFCYSILPGCTSSYSVIYWKYCYCSSPHTKYHHKQTCSLASSYLISTSGGHVTG